MEKISKVVDRANNRIKSETGPVQASRNAGVNADGRDHIDAINQVFAELELAYHNQFHKAYAQAGSAAIAKKYWLECLSRFTPAVIVKAVREVVSHQEYLPSVATMVSACENSLTLFGLPSKRDAYIEACCAPLPKASYQWSHPAVYLAGKQTGWFELANEPEGRIQPLFEYYYSLQCERVLQGQELQQIMPNALPDPNETPLSVEENKQKLAELKSRLNLA